MFQQPDFIPTVQRVDRGCGPRTTCFADMCRALTPGVPVVIHVHGSFVTTGTVLHEAESTYRWLHSAAEDRPYQLISFSWPSFRAVVLPTARCDVNLMGRRAARNGWYLAEMLRSIPPECPVCLLGHSHGSRVIAAALHLMAGGRVQGVQHPCARVSGRRIRTVFAASAMRHDWLNPGERYGRALCSTECLLNLTNSQDIALKLYPLRHILSGQALGDVGFTHRDRKVLRGWSRKVRDADVSAGLGHRHRWPNYTSKRHLAWFIRNYAFYADQPPVVLPPQARPDDIGSRLAEHALPGPGLSGS